MSHVEGFWQHSDWSTLERGGAGRQWPGYSSFFFLWPCYHEACGILVALSLSWGHWWIYMCIQGAQRWLCGACIAYHPIRGCTLTAHISGV